MPSGDRPAPIARTMRTNPPCDTGTKSRMRCGMHRAQGALLHPTMTDTFRRSAPCARSVPRHRRTVDVTCHAMPRHRRAVDATCRAMPPHRRTVGATCHVYVGARLARDDSAPCARWVCPRRQRNPGCHLTGLPSGCRQGFTGAGGGRAWVSSCTRSNWSRICSGSVSSWSGTVTRPSAGMTSCASTSAGRCSSGKLTWVVRL